MTHAAGIPTLTAMQAIEPARLIFRDGVPCAEDFGDVYFSREDGLAEARHVFLSGNDLPARWAGRTGFVIGETGFGTGLNFLLTAAEWQRQAPAGARLHYLSVEKHPLRRDDLARALAPWPQLAPHRETLLSAWPPPVEGLHRLELAGGRVVLSLLFGEAEALLAQLDARVDAWYLDGFAPARNPAMWQPSLLAQLARLSRPGATFATFTAAGQVRRNLLEAGFDVHKRQGFGRKREMLAGRIDAPPPRPAPSPWFALPRAAASERRALVVGAGLAGATCARALAERGWEITVLERQAIASAASGNPAGVLMPRLNAVMDASARFHLGAFLNTLAWLGSLARHGLDTGFRQTGVLQLDRRRRHVTRIHPALPADVVIALDRSAAEARAGQTLAGDALYYPLGGWLTPARLCRHLLDHPRIEVRTGTPLQALDFADGRWRVALPDGPLLAPNVVLANGAEAMRLVPDGHWNLQAVRGQVSWLQAPRNAWPALPVSGDGYVTPTEEDFLLIGATFDAGCHAPALREQDHQANLARLRESLPDLARFPVDGGRVGFRTSSPDRLPLIGPVPDMAWTRQAYAALRHGPLRRALPPARYLPGLYVTTAHGARGLATCPIAALHIAALLENEPLPLLRDTLDRIHPGRFLVRHLQRRRD